MSGPAPPVAAPDTVAEAATESAGGRVSWSDRDHTRGSLLRSLWVLALPLLATSATGVVYQLADLTMVSRLGQEATTAVIVANQSIRQLLFMFVMGASFGAQGLISRHVGEGRGGAAEHVTGQLVVMGLIFSCAVAVLGAFGPEAILRFMNVSADVLAIGVSYLRWILLLNFGFVFLFLFSAVLNGAGDSATPMRIAVVQTVASLVAEWLLIFGPGALPALGVDGVALGVVAGQAVGLTLAGRVLFRGRSRVHLRLHHLRPDPAVIRHIASLSWPPGLQMIGGFIVSVFFLRLIADFGDRAQAAYSIGLRLSMVGPMLAFPLAGACATLVGQNLGAGNVPRAWRALRVGLAVHASLLWSVAVGLAVFRYQIVGAFSDEPEVIRIGGELLLYQAGVFFFWGFYFVLLRGLQGAGDVRLPMLISLSVSLLVTLPLGTWLATEAGLGLGPTGIFRASLTGAFLVTVLTGAWLATGRWTRRAPESTPPPA